MLAIVCPGQGSQVPGFLEPWLELDGMRSLLEQWSDASGVDLVTHGTVSDELTIKDTAVAQPLIVAAGILSAQSLKLQNLPAERWLAAGHSVGEITASALAGVLDPTQALDFVRIRATGMAAAANETPTGMAAVLGGKHDDVVSHLENFNLTPANVNGGGQIVAAGTQTDLERLAEQPPAKTRVIPLKVAGAFHTNHMQPAVPALAALAKSLNPADPTVRLLSNRDGAFVASGSEVLERLVSQVTQPVRWDLCMDSMKEEGVTGIIELLPGGTLVGLAKRALRGVPSVAIKSPEDIDKALAFISEHAE